MIMGRIQNFGKVSTFCRHGMFLLMLIDSCAPDLIFFNLIPSLIGTVSQFSILILSFFFSTFAAEI